VSEAPKFPINKETSCAILAIDAVGHSKIVRGLARQQVRRLFDDLEGYVRERVRTGEGELLGWAGDGGIAAFSSADDTQDTARAERVLHAAENILGYLPVLNKRYKTEPKLAFRIALHSGSIIWRKDAGSIHSEDINFVAHLEHALPENIIGLSAEFHKSLDEKYKAHCEPVEGLEGHVVFLYSDSPDALNVAKGAYATKRLKIKLGEVCFEHGLVTMEFRDRDENKLPDTRIYSEASSEIFMAGPTLVSSFKPGSTLTSLREANKKGVKLKLLLFHPDHFSSFNQGAVDTIRQTLNAVRRDVETGELNRGSIEIRGLKHWPHFLGVMIDGDVDGSIEDEPASTIKNVCNLVLRVQTLAPPESADAVHYGPVLIYGGGKVTKAMGVFIGGFRDYWQNAELINLW